MLVALYRNADLLGFITQAEYDFTLSAFDNDSFSVSGAWLSDEAIDSANIFVICNDSGIATAYSGFARNIVFDKETRKVTFTGRDFREILDTDIQLEFLSTDSMRLGSIIYKILSKVYSDDLVRSVSWRIDSSVSSSTIDTTSVFGDLRGTYQIVNAWSFLHAYLAYYQVYIHAGFNGSEIVFTAQVHGHDNGTASEADASVYIDDFIYSRDSQALGINHAVATMSSDVSPRPSLTEVHYWLYSDDTIHQTTSPGSGAVFPVRSRVCQSEYLAQAQVDAVLALAEARYPYNITISDSDKFGPVDLVSTRGILDKIAVYSSGVFQRLIPVSAKTISFKGGLLRSKIKLGLKKAFLTDYIRS